jgi:hypothetical protein
VAVFHQPHGEATVKKNDKHDEKRILTRRVAKQLDDAALKAAAGGTATMIDGIRLNDTCPF